MDKFTNERKNYPPLTKAAYFDHGTSGLIPEYACSLMCDYLRNRTENGMGINGFWDNWDYADNLRSDIGKMLNCSPNEIAYGQSSTQLYNIFANGIELERGDNVVTAATSYPADAYVWRNKASEGIELRLVETDDGYLSAEALMERTDSRTKAVSVCMVEHLTGMLHDVKRIGNMCGERGIPFVVDATQAVGALKIDMNDLNVDFLTTSGYKWLQSPLGIGFAYINENFLPRLKQSVIGWVGTKNRSKNKAEALDLSENANRFELGGMNFVALRGMGAVIERYNGLGADDIDSYIRSLSGFFYEEASAFKKFKIMGGFPSENRSQIVVIKPPEGLIVTDGMLEPYGVSCRCYANGCIRAGFHYCNNQSDIERLIDCLIDIENKF